MISIHVSTSLSVTDGEAPVSHVVEFCQPSEGDAKVSRRMLNSAGGALEGIDETSIGGCGVSFSGGMLVRQSGAGGGPLARAVGWN